MPAADENLSPAKERAESGMPQKNTGYVNL